jgi:cytochrome P450 family 142 subfamily A polypeptide 1
MARHPVRDDIDLLDGHWWAEQPYETWAWMRENAPVYYDERNATWAVTRHADVLAVERNPGDFSSKRSPRPHGDPLPMMISMDNPEHHRRRALVQRGFTPKRVTEHEARVQTICTEIIDKVCEQGHCDFVWDVAAPLPLLIIADLLGFPPSSYDDLLTWSDDLIRGTTGTPTPEVQLKAMEAGIAFREFQLGVIADRRAKPGDDLVSTLVHSEIDGSRLDDESIVQESLLILIGGDETTRHVITCGTLALMDFPEQAEILRAEPDAMLTGVEELLRWVSPIKNMSRTVQRDLEFGGQAMTAEDQVIVVYPSANRDASVFADPDRLDVRRDPNPHLAFGFGPHFCLGASLARLELKVMFTEILRRLPDLRLADGVELPWRASNFITGPEAMPVVFTPTERVGDPSS